jgi:phospholipid/cholesterol/gamma-HCH transport system permease protein
MTSATETISAETRLHASRPSPDKVLVRFEGDWTTGAKLPPANPVLEEMGADVRSVAFDMAAVSGWDSSLLTLLLKVINRADELKIEIDREGLQEGVRKLLAYLEQHPEALLRGKSN